MKQLSNDWQGCRALEGRVLQLRDPFIRKLPTRVAFHGANSKMMMGAIMAPHRRL